MDTTNVTPVTPTEVLVEQTAPIEQESTDLAMLTADSIHRFDPQVQAQIMRVADEIDPIQLDKILAYGSIPLIRTYESAGQILKSAEGTSVDQEVIDQVVELAKLANKGQEDVNISLKEPNWIEKLLMNIFTSIKEKKNDETQVKAITCYRLLTQLKEKCDVWHSMLQENWRLICQSITDDMQNGIELEQYIVAAHVAMPRLEASLEEKRVLSETQGLITDKAAYDAYKKGLDAFKVTLLNLEKSRAAYGISLAQLSAQKSTNENIQISVSTQKHNSMSVASQQLRNALLERRNRQVLEGQKSITALNGELMKKVASNTVLTAEESEKVLLSGVYTLEAALEAAKTVVDGCEAIRKARDERAQNVAQQMDKLKTLVDQISPFINNMKEEAESQEKSSASSSSGLSF